MHIIINTSTLTRQEWWQQCLTSRLYKKKFTVGGICSIRNTFPQALPVDKTCDGRRDVLCGCAIVPVREEGQLT